MRYYKKAIAAIMAVAVLVGLEPYIERTNIHGVQCASAQTLEDTMETSAQLSESATGIPTQTPDVTQGVSACDYYQNMSTIGKDTSVVTISNADDLRAYIKIMQKVTGFGLTFVQTADIALSDYNFRYEESLKRIAVYDEDTLKCTVASDGTAYQPDYSEMLLRPHGKIVMKLRYQLCPYLEKRGMVRSWRFIGSIVHKEQERLLRRSLVRMQRLMRTLPHWLKP